MIRFRVIPSPSGTGHELVGPNGTCYGVAPRAEILEGTRAFLEGRGLPQPLTGRERVDAELREERKKRYAHA